jgi:hypothetical protein
MRDSNSLGFMILDITVSILDWGTGPEKLRNLLKACM